MNENISNLINNFDKINLQERYKLINENNKDVIELLKKELKDEKIINIVAKGPSATYIENAHAINQGAIFTNKKYVYLNDIHSLFGLEEFIKDMKFVFFPDYPHFNCKSHNAVTYITVLKYLIKYNFNGNVFIYKLQTSKLKNTFLNSYSLSCVISTSLPILILTKWCKLNTPFHTYGYKRGNGYHTDLNDKVYKDKYEERKQSYLWIGKTCNIPQNYCLKVCNRLEKFYKSFNKIDYLIKPVKKNHKFFIH